MIKGYCNSWRSVRAGRNLCCPHRACDLPQKSLGDDAVERRNANLPVGLGSRTLEGLGTQRCQSELSTSLVFCLEIKFCPWLGLETALPSVCKVLRVRGRMENSHIPLIKYLLYHVSRVLFKNKVWWLDRAFQCKNSAFSLAVVAYGLFFWEHNTAWLCPTGLGRALSKAKMGTPFVTINSHNRYENYIGNLLESEAFSLLFFISFHFMLYVCKITAKLCIWKLGGFAPIL